MTSSVLWQFLQTANFWPTPAVIVAHALHYHISSKKSLDSFKMWHLSSSLPHVGLPRPIQWRDQSCYNRTRDLTLNPRMSGRVFRVNFAEYCIPTARLLPLWTLWRLDHIRQFILFVHRNSMYEQREPMVRRAWAISLRVWR